VLIRIGDFTPPGVQGVLDAWLGVAPEVLPLIGLAALTIVAGALAVRVFRWE
jgi:ABC-2 type transport system permease protein